MRKGLLVMLSILMVVVVAACRRDPEPESITFDMDSVLVEIGESVTVTATVEPEDAAQDVMWVIEDTSIATIDDGVVTGVAVGTTTLTATSLEDEDITASIDVEVYADPESVTIIPDPVEVVLDETVDVSATIEPEEADQDVTWSIADESIATFADGVVTGVSVGETTLTATSVADDTVTAVVDVHVIYADPTSVVVEPDPIEVERGETVDVTATVEPANADQEVTWEIADTDIATIEGGVITGVAKGTTTLTVKSVADEDVYAEIDIEVYTVPGTVYVTPDPVRVGTGRTVEVEAEIAPEDAPQEVTWSIANTDIATVDEDGEVTGVAVGNTILTVRSADDESIYETVVVEVFAAPESIMLRPAMLETLEIGDTVEITADVSPEEANQGVTWEIGDTDVATFADGILTAVGPGETTLTATSVVYDDVYAVLEIEVIDQYEPEMTVAEVWDLDDGEDADTMGIVTKMTDHRTFFIEGRDGDRAIAVYDWGEDYINDLEIGDYVRVVGERGIFAGLQQIGFLDKVEVIDTGWDLPAFQDINDVDFDEDDDMMEYQGYRVMFEGFEVESIDEDEHGNITVVLVSTENDEEISLRYDSRLPDSEDAADALLALEEGDEIIIYGMILGWYDGPQLLYTDATEFALAEGGELSVAHEELELPLYEWATYLTEFSIFPEAVFPQEAEFASSDDDIATVDEFGLVTPQDLGTVEITVSSEYALNDVVVTITVVEDLELTPGTGAFNFRHAEVEDKHRAFARAEDWLLRTMAGGIPVMTNDSYMMLEPRMELPTGVWIPVMSYGVSFSGMTQDDSNVLFLDTDDYGEEGKYTYRQRSGETPGTLFSWEYEGAWEADVITLFEDGLYYFDYDDDMTGYEVKPSMADGEPVALNPEMLPTGLVVADKYQVNVREDLEWSYHPDIDTSDFPEGHENITAEDFYKTWKIALTEGWMRAISGGGDFTSAPQRIVGAQEYIDDQVDWEDVGIKLIDDYTLELHFHQQVSDWDVRYWLSGFTLSPINLALYEEVGDQYGTDHLTIASHGPYIMDYYEPDSIIRFSENPNFHHPDRHFFTNWNVYIISETETAFDQYMEGYLDTVGVPPAQFDDVQDHPDLVEVPGPTTWRINFNANATIGRQQDMFPGSDWVPEPILGEQEFLLALYHGINREELTSEVVPTYGPNMYHFSSQYMVDPAGGVPFRLSAWADTVAEGMGKDTHGYLPSLSETLFKDVIADLVARGTYDAGTEADPTMIELEFGIFADSPAQLAFAEFISSEWSALFYCDTHHIGVEFDIVTKEAGVLYDDMDAGEFDLSIGGISGMTLDAGNFLMVYRDDNMSNFTLSWGISTSEPEIEVYAINMDTGLWGRHEFSFNALHHMFAGTIRTEDGVPAG